jgi:hypothetical protein
MALDRRATEMVRKLDEFELRQLVILARGRLQHFDGPQFDDGGRQPKVSFRQQHVRCGKPTCNRCPHGPYWYAYWREGDKVRSRYIGKTAPAPSD